MKLTTTDIANRNKAITKDFATGKFTKVALARKYGVDERTIRRVLQEGSTKTAPQPVQKDVKASVKQKAKALTSAKKSAKATTTDSAKSQYQAAPLQPDFKFGDRVTCKSDKHPVKVVGVVMNVRNTCFSSDNTTYVDVLWPNYQSSIAYHADDLELADKAVETPVEETDENSVKSALKAGQKVEYVMTQDSIMMTLGDDVEIVDQSHQNYKLIQTAIVDGDYKGAYDLMNITKAINKFTKGAIHIEGGELYYGEMQLRSTLVDRILALMAEGDGGFKRLINFLERLLNNPSKQSVEELWGFVSHLDVDIDDEGYIIGWKKVKSRNGRLFDSYTGRVPNDVGNIVEMPRHMVNDNRDQTCSQGLHVGAWDYVKSFSGDTILKVKVDPADVVSVPSDYNDMKMRAAKYIVIDTVDGYDKSPLQFKRAADVKTLHVKVGQAGEILDSVEI